MKFCRDVGDPLFFPTSSAYCLCRVSFRLYSPLSLEVVEKQNKIMQKIFGPHFREEDPDFSTAHCYHDLLFTVVKDWLSSVC